VTIKAACITFPGSNCDQDMHRAIRHMGWELVKVWHSDPIEQSVDVVLVPGGFSYGDYLRCGALARFSTAMRSVKEHADRGGLVMGVCNGFQILCEAGLLPGALTRNKGIKFRCLWTHLRVAHSDSAFTAACEPSQVLRIPIAHGEGNYQIAAAELAGLRERGQILFEYCDAGGVVSDAANPNGAVAHIAGVANAAGNVMGMMPHPERAMEDLLGGTDGRFIFRSIEAALSRAGA